MLECNFDVIVIEVLFVRFEWYKFRCWMIEVIFRIEWNENNGKIKIYNNDDKVKLKYLYIYIILNNKRKWNMYV